MPIRVKLTAWYSAVLAVTLVLFGAVAFYGMRESLEAAVDEALRDRAVGIQELMKGVLPQGPEGLAGELREHAELEEEANLSQVAGPDGHWIYRSPLMRRYDVPRIEGTGTVIYDLRVQSLPLRVLTTQANLSGQNYRIQVAAPMDDYQDALDHFRWVLLLLSPLLLLLASAGGYWMSRRALTPVDEITRAARTISARNLSSRLAVPPSRDELQRLSETLNAMLERLEVAFKRITQFTADASHELRTPVALMRTTAELSLRKPRQEAEYRDALTEILRELERTSTLIEKLMLLARADSGAETVQFVRHELAENFREACRQGRTLTEAKGLSFQEQIAEGPMIVEGDAHALRRLFLLLIDNAVKYTPAGGQVSACLKAANGFAVAEIRDTGIGISEADLAHIFERFYRADKARSREMGGAGLGLSIGRWIAEAHAGTIEVESAVGQGSKFRVRLPISKS